MRETVTTRTGVMLEIDRAGPTDLGELRQFFGQLSSEDLRFRFLETVRQVDEAVLQRMVDGGGDTTFLARAGQVLVAVATLVASGDRKAEVALSTLPAWKGKGVSWTLLDHVLAYARTHGFTLVSSLEAADNHEALALEREMGFVARLNCADPPEILASKAL